jgi:transcriptional regulator with XRE-family HTH domain
MTGQDLKEIRKQMGLNQTQIAKAAGTSQNAISRIETGRASFVDDAQAVLAAYGLKVVRTVDAEAD